MNKYKVVGEYPAKANGVDQSVLMEIVCKDISDARAVLLERLGVYNNLHILNPEGNITK